jgi:hypothetical protein
MAEKTTTAINFEMSIETNKVITDSAAINKRTKRKEAAARLEDHAKRFDVINSVYVSKTK